MALAILFVAVVFIASFLSVSPSLHEHLHHDAAQSSHQCAITVFQQQHLLTSNPNVVVAEPSPGLSVSTVTSGRTVVPEGDYLFSISRAPPFSFSSLA